ncbi:hypothetical protein M0813_16025 [Anaeramoeba flamelloides]|uniref:Uncharacterized protein n=1 Tax=Anaeramoeba flamelloides TaxID=1746091 RepID=A0ABQ8Z165_9EUKA|nr:hypothetical protein M0813_16025 [Anaeramoeba flamelloides]
MASDAYNLYGTGTAQTTFYIILSLVFLSLFSVAVYLLIKLYRTSKNQSNKIWRRVTIFLVISLFLRFMAMALLLVPSLKSITQSSFVAFSDIFLLYCFTCFVVFWVLTSVIIFSDLSVFTTFKKKFLSRKKLYIIFWSYVSISFVLILILVLLEVGKVVPEKSQKAFSAFTYYFVTLLLMISGIVWFFFGVHYGKLFLKITEKLDINMGSEQLRKKTYSAMFGALFMGLSQCVPLINIITRISDKTTNSSQLSVLIIKSIFLCIAILFFFRAIYIIVFKLSKNQKIENDVELGEKQVSKSGSRSESSTNSNSSSSTSSSPSD